VFDVAIRHARDRHEGMRGYRRDKGRQQPGLASADQSKRASFIQDGLILSIKSEETK
jgi:hypothetical protein